MGEIVDEFLKAKENAGLSKRYIETLGPCLLRFAALFETNISSVTTGAITRWLDNLNLGPRSLNNVSQAVVALFNFAAPWLSAKRRNNEAANVKR